MFICGKCGRQTASGEPAKRVVVETRRKVYPYREYAMKRGRGPNRRWIADPGGEGVEVVREELHHESC